MSSSEEEIKNKTYKGKDPMSPEEILSHEPTAVKRDPRDQIIAKGGKTGTDTEEAKEMYRKEGMTKVYLSEGMTKIYLSEEEIKHKFIPYTGKDPMSPEEILSHEPTAVKRDPRDQIIAKGGKTGTDTEEAKEMYRKEGMTKIYLSEGMTKIYLSEEEIKHKFIPYTGKDPMSPEEILSHEPTAVKRDPRDQIIAKGGKTGTDTEEAKERYRKEGMTKV